MDDAVPRSLLFICLLLAGGFFAGTETALSYCNRIRMQVLADDGDKRAKRVVSILDQFDRAVVTLLIAINVIYTTAASVATIVAVNAMGNIGSVIATVFSTLAVFLCCETIPKNFARANSDAYILRVSLPLKFFMTILKPVALLLTGLGSFVKKIVNRHVDSVPSVTEDEFASIVTDAEEDGVIDHDESTIIKSAIDFGDIVAGEVMTRRENMVTIPVNIDHESLRKILLDNKYSRFPVYDGNPDHIVGILRSVRCLWKLMNGTRFDVRETLTRPYFVRPDMPISHVFEGMSARRAHMAIVQDEGGHTIGMLTMEDILEEIVGEIYDEDDNEGKSAAAPQKPQKKEAGK